MRSTTHLVRMWFCAPAVVLTACTPTHLATSIGWAVLGLLTVCALRPRMSRADDGVDAGSSDMTTSDSGVDAGVSEPLMQACLCAASPGASLPLQVERVVAQPLTDLRARVLEALPPDVRARLED